MCNDDDDVIVVCACFLCPVSRGSGVGRRVELKRASSGGDNSPTYRLC